MERLPEGIVVSIWALAEGRPVHPVARLFKQHFEITRERVDGLPCFFEDPGCDLVRACRMHRVGRSSPDVQRRDNRRNSEVGVDSGYGEGTNRTFC